MSGAAFPLSSSAGYAFMAKAKQGGLSIVAVALSVLAGDIALMGPNGDAYAGNGPIGHCGIVVAVYYRVGHWWVLCIESRGHHGVCLQERRLDWWSMFVRQAGWTEAHTRAARAWEALYDADTGTVARVTYYAGAGDNDHDGEPDRADIFGDGNGIDCSGAVKLCADYAYDHAGAPATPAFTREQLDAFIAYLKEIDVEHGYMAGAAVDDRGRVLVLDRQGGLHLCEHAGVVDVKWQGGKYSPGDDIMRELHLLNTTPGQLAGYAIDLNGNAWPFAEPGGTLPPTLASPQLPAAVIARI
jgi:hypothetical protein